MRTTRIALFTLGAVVAFSAVARGVDFVNGVDASHYQGTINWTLVRSAGMKFVFPKATEGVDFVDDHFLQYMNGTGGAVGAIGAGLLVGPYHFGRPDSGISVVSDPVPNPDAVNEANDFCDSIQSFYTSATSGRQMLRPVLDIERTTGVTAAAVAPMTVKQYVSKWSRDFAARVQTRLGVAPIIYTYTSYADTYLDSTLTSYPLWIASYNATPPSVPVASAYDPWTDFKFWQYTDAGTVSGISGGVDRDVFKGTSEQLGAYLPKYFAGDYNGDNVVDARDYIVWRDSLGKTVGYATGADGDLSGVIDAADYNIWKSHFGAVKGAGSGAGAGGIVNGTGVPEPGTLILGLIVAVVLAARNRRGRRQAEGV